MKEIWRKINERYSVSNLGNVKSNYANKEKVLKPFVDVRGYLKVDLRSPGYRKSVFVHRLVAEAFIPNPLNKKEVNHIDEDKTNNKVDNLEWCDTHYNCNFGTRNTRKALNCQKKVCSRDAEGNVAHYASVKEAGEKTGITRTNISKVLSDNYPNKTAGGLKWFYDIE